MTVALDSARWSSLQHAYGTASDIPALLRQLATAPASTGSNEPWHTLWSSLCHQGTVYTASYAATPHIAEAAGRRVPKERLDYIVLVASISGGRDRADAAEMPNDLSEDFERALKQTAGSAIECLSTVTWSSSDYRSLLGSIAVLQSHQQLGALLLAFDDTYECPNCNKRLTETLI